LLLLQGGREKKEGKGRERERETGKKRRREVRGVEGERGRNQAAKYFGLELLLPVINTEDNKKSD